MDFVQGILFESPVWLGMLCFVLFAIALLMRPRMEGRRRGLMLPGVLGLTVVLFVMQWAVQTERERILVTLDTFVNGIEGKNMAAWSGAIGQGYDSEGLDHDGMVAFLKGAFDVADIYDTRLRRRDVHVDGDRASMTLGATATVRVKGNAGEMHTGRWHLDWAREGDGWKIVAIRPEMVDATDIKSLTYLRGMLPGR